jgi:hypothetical protein
MNDNNKYFQTKSKVFAYAIQYITNQNYYKFQDNKNITIYSFEINDNFYEKINKLNDIKFS